MTDRVTRALRPTMRRGRGRLRQAARRGGAGMLFFVMIGLPLLVSSAAFAVDIGIQIAATTQAISVAEAAAEAGAQVQQQDRNQLDRSRAEQSAREVAQRAFDEGMFSLGVRPRVSVRANSSRVVQVDVTYRLPSRVFVRFIQPGISRNEEFTIRRTAYVCTPGDTTLPTGGFCAAPRP